MRFWIDIENSSGTKQGGGPIVSATSWYHVARINRAGAFRFQMAATDDRADEVQNKRVARCYGVMDGAPTSLGAGIIDQVETVINANGDAMLMVSGDDLLRELANRTVGELKIFQTSTTLTPDASDRHDPGAGTDLDLVTNSPITISTSQFIYIGHNEPFDAWTPTISTGNGNASTLSAQYYSTEQNGWRSITITDGSSLLSRTLAQTGAVTWTRPDDWRSYLHNSQTLYWIRFQVSANTSNVTFTNSQISGHTADTSGPADIIAFAPSGWSLDTVTGYNATSKSVRHTFNGESVLAALVKLAELTGERFRLGTGRKVVWLQDDETASGIRAAAHSASPLMHDETSVCTITALRKVEDTYKSYVGRIYPVGKDGVTLESTTKSAPAGYTLGSGTAGHYLQHDATWSSYGVELWERFGDVDTPDDLYEAAKEELDRRKDAYAAYDLNVVGLEAVVSPGDTIAVQYRRIVDGYTAVDIDDDFVILETVTQVSGDGLKTVGMRVATTDRYPDSGAEALARLL